MLLFRLRILYIAAQVTLQQLWLSEVGSVASVCASVPLSLSLQKNTAVRVYTSPHLLLNVSHEANKRNQYLFRNVH